MKQLINIEVVYKLCHSLTTYLDIVANILTYERSVIKCPGNAFQYGLHGEMSFNGSLKLWGFHYSTRFGGVIIYLSREYSIETNNIL